MHELPATRGILAIALDTARANNAARVKSIDIHIGEMTSIVDDSVQFYFDVLSKDTLASGAVLNFKRFEVSQFAIMRARINSSPCILSQGGRTSHA